MARVVLDGCNDSSKYCSSLNSVLWLPHQNAHVLTSRAKVSDTDVRFVLAICTTLLLLCLGAGFVAVVVLVVVAVVVIGVLGNDSIMVGSLS